MALYNVEVVRDHTGYLTKDEYPFVSNSLQELLDKIDERIVKSDGLIDKLPFKRINVLLYSTVLADRYNDGAWKV